MRMLRVWRPALVAGIVAVFYWSSHLFLTGTVPSSTLFGSTISISRYWDVVGVMVIVALFTFVLQRLYRHVLTPRQAAVGSGLAFTVCALMAFRNGWPVENTLVFVTGSSLLAGVILAMLRRVTPVAGPTFLWYAFTIQLVVSAPHGYVEGAIELVFSLIAGATGLLIGAGIRRVTLPVIQAFYPGGYPKQDGG